jgi:hypothetical protein
MYLLRLFIAALAASCFSVSTSLAQTIVPVADTTENVPEEVINCKVGFYVKTIRINQSEETFDVLFYYWLRVDSIDITKDYSHVKTIEFVNSESDAEEHTEVIDTLNRFYYVAGRCKANIPYKANFVKFPFDIQALTISLENTVYNNDVVRYIPDDLTKNINDIKENNIEFLNGDQYSVKELVMKTTDYTYATNFGDPAIKGFDEYSRLVFSVDVKRDPWGILQKIALPLLVVLILSYLVFFIPDHEIGTASGLTVTALLAAIAFQWTLNDSLPKVSYLTMIDKIFYLVYFYIFYAMAQTVITYNMSETKNENLQVLSDRIEWHSRYLFPLTFILFFLYIISV